MVGKVRFSNLLAPKSLSAFEAEFPRLKTEGSVRDTEFDLVRKEGAILPAPASATAVTDPRGNYLMSRSMVCDMTERKPGEDEVRRLARLQAEVAGLGQDALRVAPLLEVLDGAVTRVARALGVDYCNVAEMLPGGDEFLLRAGIGWKEGLVGRATVKSSGSLAGYTVLSDGPVTVENAATETRFAPLPLLLGEPVVSSISVVISTVEGPYGALGAHSRRRRAFTPDEVNFLQAVANVLGMAVERRRAEERLRLVNRAHRALSACNQAVVRATAEFRAAPADMPDHRRGSRVSTLLGRLCGTGRRQDRSARRARGGRGRLPEGGEHHLG